MSCDPLADAVRRSGQIVAKALLSRLRNPCKPDSRVRYAHSCNLVLAIGGGVAESAIRILWDTRAEFTSCFIMIV